MEAIIAPVIVLSMAIRQHTLPYNTIWTSIAGEAALVVLALWTERGGRPAYEILRSYNVFNQSVFRLTALAAWAEEGRASGVRDAADAGLTSWTRFAFAVVNAPAAFVAPAVIAAVYIFRVNVHGRTVRD